MMGAAILSLAAPEFTLSWTHSIEKVRWRETWVVQQDGLLLTRAEVKGSGAGMEPGDDARLENGWWVWNPGLNVPLLRLAASGATGQGWTLCSGGQCFEIGAQAASPLTLAPCP